MNILKEFTYNCRFLTGGDGSNEDSVELSLESVTDTARFIAKDVIFNHLLEPSSCGKTGPKSAYSRTMLRLVRELSDRHEILFEKNVKLVVGQSQNGVCSIGEGLKQVVNQMLKDEQTNWGRIVTIYTFSFCTARYCKAHDMSNMVESIVDATGDCVRSHVSDWILNQGGWEAFEKQFSKEETTESKIWTGLLCTFAFGLGTIATITALK